MKSQVLIKRYTQGLNNSIKSEEEFLILSRQLLDFQNLLSTQKDLKKILASAFLPTSKKIEIAKEVLANVSLEAKASRFILLLVEKNRLELLPSILEFLPILWNEEKGISTFEVSSVVPLTDIQKRRLEEELESLEKNPVSLNYKINPSLIGGLSIRKGNIIYDVSIQGNLLRLKEIISEG